MAAILTGTVVVVFAAAWLRDTLARVQAHLATQLRALYLGSARRPPVYAPAVTGRLSEANAPVLPAQPVAEAQHSQLQLQDQLLPTAVAVGKY
jgi:hypothetical protein